MDLPAAPAGFKGILSRQGKQFRGSGEAPVHHLLQDTNDGGGGGGGVGVCGCSIINQEKRRNPSGSGLTG